MGEFRRASDRQEKGCAPEMLDIDVNREWDLPLMTLFRRHGPVEGRVCGADKIKRKKTKDLGEVEA